MAISSGLSRSERYPQGCPTLKTPYRDPRTGNRSSQKPKRQKPRSPDISGRKRYGMGHQGPTRAGARCSNAKCESSGSTAEVPPSSQREDLCQRSVSACATSPPKPRPPESQITSCDVPELSSRAAAPAPGGVVPASCCHRGQTGASCFKAVGARAVDGRRRRILFLDPSPALKLTRDSGPRQGSLRRRAEISVCSSTWRSALLCATAEAAGRTERDP